jgi:DNA-binding NarL/FixJ family response regulator
MPICRILVVEDHLQVRRFTCSTLHQRTDFQVVGEAEDGLEALLQADALQPDVILLDIGLPKLNGIEAARRILEVVPQCKILFLSLESSRGVVQQALAAGGVGYVHKLHTGRDLLAAIDAVLGGQQFISRELTRPDDVNSNPRHEVQFYSDDAACVERIARFVLPALTTGNSAIVLATKSHREDLARRLKHQRVDLDKAVQSGAFISLDAAEALAGIMINGVPDRQVFLKGLHGLIDSATREASVENPRVSIFGECVGLLCEEGHTKAALQLEKTGNDLLKTHNIEILCAYPLSVFEGKENDQAYTRICSEHTAVYYR